MSGPRESADESITLHSTWRALLSSLFGALVLFGGGLYGTIASGGSTFPIVLLVIGSIFLLVVLVDIPIAARFTRDGVERRMVLRRQFLPWERVRQITRTRPGVSVGERKISPGGLTALVGKRRYLLVDRSESMQEFYALEQVLGDRADEVGFDVLLPPQEEAPPTWLYRRPKWAPDEAKRR